MKHDKMNIDDLIDFIKETVPDHLEKQGESLYSAASTLSKGDIYLLGTNPGGAGKWSLSKDLEELRIKEGNEYIDEIWKNGKNGNDVQAGEDTLQIRVKELIKSIDYKIEDVCASNLIFYTSVGVKDLKKELTMSFNKIAERYWPIHLKILEVVQPKIILVFGNGEDDSPYAYLKRKYKINSNEIDKKKIGHGKLEAKSFVFQLNGNKCHVIGIPHLSMFKIKNKEIYTWIKEKVKG